MDGLQERLDIVARYYLSLGLSVIPIGTDKKPFIKWLEHIDKPLKNWRFPGCNIALLTGQFNNLVVADCDSEDAYIGWLKTKPQTPLRVKTKRGMQFYYRHPGVYIKSDAHIKDPSGFEYDVKGDRSYVVAPPSVRSGHQYSICVCSSNIRGKLIPFSQLPVFNPEWRPERPERCGAGNVPSWQDGSSKAGARIPDGVVRDGLAYIDRIRPVTVKQGGQGRDKDVYRAACKLVECGMSQAEVGMHMERWNSTHVTPPLPRTELLHKINRAFMQAK